MGRDVLGVSRWKRKCIWYFSGEKDCYSWLSVERLGFFSVLWLSWLTTLV